MSDLSATIRKERPDLLASLELIKPITWFPPMWAFSCGIVASGVALAPKWDLVIIGVILSGPIVCGMSQAANDWCDRHVDAINEPDRPIPSGRIPGRWGLWIALFMSALALIIALSLGRWGFIATCVAVLAAWAYSAEPFRAKRSGIWGPALVGLCYEGLPWFTGAAIMLGGFPDSKVIVIALLYAFGAHGIMTLNDFKAIEGDRETGLRSLPVILGVRPAAYLACTIMAFAQILVILLLLYWGAVFHAALIALLALTQFGAMRRLLKDPKAQAAWYNGTGVLCYVLGMMISAFALRGLI